MSDGLKRGISKALVQLGVASVARRLHSRYGMILAYHNIVPKGEVADGELSLHLEQEMFGRQLDLLTRTHEVVELDNLLTAGPSTRPRVAITFDDGYLGSLSAGLEELRARDLPATYFVSPGLLNQDTFWWDALAAGHSGVLPEDIRSAALTAEQGRQRRIVRWAEQEGIASAPVPEYCRPALPEEVRRAASQPGITIGSHTWGHPNLNQLGPNEMADEIERSREWLEQEIDSIISWLAYPYGIFPDHPTLSSYSSDFRGLTTQPQLIHLAHSSLEPGRIPRMNIPSGLTLARFELLTSGL